MSLFIMVWHCVLNNGTPHLHSNRSLLEESHPPLQANHKTMTDKHLSYLFLISQWRSTTEEKGEWGKEESGWRGRKRGWREEEGGRGVGKETENTNIKYRDSFAVLKQPAPREPHLPLNTCPRMDTVV